MSFDQKTYALAAGFGLLMSIIVGFGLVVLSPDLNDAVGGVVIIVTGALAGAKVAIIRER